MLSGKIPLVSKSLIITTLLKILGANRAEDYLQNAVSQAFSDQGREPRGCLRGQRPLY